MNLYRLPPSSGGEIADILWQAEGLRVERIVSRGDVSPAGFWYDQEEDEWVAVLEGEAELEFPSGKVSLRRGDTLLIPAHRRHRVSRTSIEPPCIWLCVFGMRR